MTTLSDAPGKLEQVRTFLNTWRIPHETRRPQDRLPELAGSAAMWRAELPDVPPPHQVELAELAELRSALRSTLDKPAPAQLREWFQRHPISVTVGEEHAVCYVAKDDGTASALLVFVVEALANDSWVRLKSCPDCRNVFYDHSRNRSRIWCSMYAETPDGRACGSIAKVRTYRSRRRET